MDTGHARVCSPMEYAGATPDFISEIIREIGSDSKVNLRDSDLRSRGIEPHVIRRWFKKNHGITFHAYQRMQRISSAFKKIQDGETVDAAAFDTGYESLSGFGESYKTVFGASPKKSNTKKIIHLTRFETPLGPMFAGAVDEGICLFEFTDRRMLETEFKTLSRKLNAVIIHGEHKHFELLKKEMDLYFQGELKEFTIPLFTIGTDFQKAVWNELIKIPLAKPGLINNNQSH
jgi:AraC family transcriptional regulator of adaptative response/methylated-DNA-[protein]-cysteine methyltransferase